MIKCKRKPCGYWTFEMCKKEALKYNTKTKYQKGSATSYKKSRENGWLNDICSHMIVLIKSKNYWTFERCQEVALKCEYRGEFQKKYSSAYKASIKNKWIDKICSHMKIIGNRYYRCIYVFEFSDNYAYVGLTRDIFKREKEHLLKGTIFKHLKNKNSYYNLIQLTDYIDIESAKKQEEKFVEKYNKDGWYILNKAKTGALGSDKKIWTFEKCKDIAKKYESKSEFREKNPKAYSAIVENKWISELCNHMSSKIHPNNYWTYERCNKESLKYETKIDFLNNSTSSYNIALKNNWLNKICSHMNEKNIVKIIGLLNDVWRNRKNMILKKTLEKNLLNVFQHVTIMDGSMKYKNI